MKGEVWSRRKVEHFMSSFTFPPAMTAGTPQKEVGLLSEERA
jgi:hypothetical protein